MNYVILKIGGSVLTYKDQSRGFRIRIARRISQEIKSAISENKFNLIIVHGTGSFGHPPAKKYRLAEGNGADPSGMGFSISKRQGFLLNGLLWMTLEKAGIPAITLPPLGIVRSKSSQIISFDLSTIKKLCLMNRVPVLFGDEVCDEQLGYSICSSDQIAVYLASKLRARTLLYATDVNGVYNLNPKSQKDAFRLTKIKINELREVIRLIKPFNQSDVSGEMAGKLSFLGSYPLDKTVIRIFSGLRSGNISKALKDIPVGTEIISG